MNKKIITFFLCIASVLTLSSCKGKTDDSASTVTPSPSTSPSAGTHYDGDYHAGNNGNVGDDTHTVKPTPDSGTNNGTSLPDSSNTENGRNNTGNGPVRRGMDEIGDTVDDLINNAENALRRNQK